LGTGKGSTRQMHVLGPDMLVMSQLRHAVSAFHGASLGCVGCRGIERIHITTMRPFGASGAAGSTVEALEC
jgi:hypothetical protein